jgi:hypothetical protein
MIKRKGMFSLPEETGEKQTKTGEIKNEKNS